MSDNLQSDGRRFAAGNRVDAGISIVLFVISLTFYSLHWLMLPPPRAINVDAVRLGMYAHDLLQDGVFSFYVYHLLAPNPLIIYIQAPVFVVFGYSISSIQGITAVGGALATPAIYWAARWFFADQGTAFARRAGLFAALGLALSTSFATLSRYGTEHPLLAVVVASSSAFLWRGFRRGGKLDFILAGVMVGVSQYVYISARFFPVALAAAGVGAVLANRQLLAHWRGLIWATACAALVALPQWILFVTHPFTFSARVSNPYEPTGGQFVFELPDPVDAVAVKLASQLTAVCCYWSNFYGSLALAPLLTPILVAGLIAGLAAVIWARRDETRRLSILFGDDGGDGVAGTSDVRGVRSFRRQSRSADSGISIYLHYGWYGDCNHLVMVSRQTSASSLDRLSGRGPRALIRLAKTVGLCHQNQSAVPSS